MVYNNVNFSISENRIIMLHIAAVIIVLILIMSVIIAPISITAITTISTMDIIASVMIG